MKQYFKYSAVSCMVILLALLSSNCIAQQDSIQYYTSLVRDYLIKINSTPAPREKEVYYLEIETINYFKQNIAKQEGVESISNRTVQIANNNILYSFGEQYEIFQDSIYTIVVVKIDQSIYWTNTPKMNQNELISEQAKVKDKLFDLCYVDRYKEIDNNKSVIILRPMNKEELPIDYLQFVFNKSTGEVYTRVTGYNKEYNDVERVVCHYKNIDFNYKKFKFKYNSAYDYVFSNNKKLKDKYSNYKLYDEREF